MSAPIRIAPQDVRLGVRAGSKEAAIRAAGGVLVQRGSIEPGYVESMLAREEQANTYLGSGIAIPHGKADDRELIARTGVSVVQLAESVEWNEGQWVRLVVGIAARSDEHLGILAALTDVLDDAALAERLAFTDDAHEIVAALERGGDGRPGTPAEELDDARHVDVVLPPGHGLHARPATYLVDVATPFEAEIRVRYGNRVANAKALASLLKLGAEGGETIRISAAGPGAEAALAALQEAVQGGLGEEEQAASAPSPEARRWTPRSDGRAIAGVAASPGLALGPLFQFQQTRIMVADRTADDPALEKARLAQALETAREQLGEVYESVKARSGKGEAAIFRAHQALLADEDLIAEVHARIDEGHGAAWAWRQAIGARVDEISRVDDERLAARAADLHDVGERVLGALAGT
ncbi:MAG TPA: HPr family phosphocarrier protein, partial [Longimicrobiaceae bacterium]